MRVVKYLSSWDLWRSLVFPIFLCYCITKKLLSLTPHLPTTGLGSKAADSWSLQALRPGPSPHGNHLSHLQSWLGSTISRKLLWKLANLFMRSMTVWWKCLGIKQQKRPRFLGSFKTVKELKNTADERGFNKEWSLLLFCLCLCKNQSRHPYKYLRAGLTWDDFYRNHVSYCPKELGLV
jgi:hypothetical protein